MAITAASLAAKQRILSACVRLFLEKGYKRTTVAEILKAANVSASTFQNIFHTKDGVFIELVRFMFDNQFNIALKYTEQNFPPVFIYALETSIQLTLTELNENVREMYLEAYRQPQSAEYIYRHMAIRLYQTFHSYLPACTERDFYELEIASAGIMRGFMAKPCDVYFTMNDKLRRFLGCCFTLYHVPQSLQEQVIESVLEMDLHTTAVNLVNSVVAQAEAGFEAIMNK